MFKSIVFISSAAVCFSVFSPATAHAEGAAFIAGTAPSERPANAPRITKFAPPEGWRDAALFGVEQPYPASLAWLDDQGAWFNPFLRPGMTGPYDIRGWHSAP